MKNNIDAKWFRTYLIKHKCNCDETMGTTETWVREDKWAQFNGTIKVIEESTIKDVLQKLQLSFTDLEKEWNSYNQ